MMLFFVFSVFLFVLLSRGLTMVSVKGLTTCGGITRVSYTVESGGIGPWGGAPRAMPPGAGQYAFVNVSHHF